MRLVGSQIGTDEHLTAAANEVVEPLLQALGRAERLMLVVGPRAIFFAGEAVSPPAPADESVAALLARWHVKQLVIGRRLHAAPLLDLCTMIANGKQLAPGDIVLGVAGPETRPVPLDSMQGLLRGYLDDSSAAMAVAAGAGHAEPEPTPEGDGVDPPALLRTERRETPTVPTGARPRPEPPAKPRRKHMTGNMDVSVDGEESWMDKFNDSALDTDVNGILDDLL